jgi:hypothetical protein
MRILHSFYYFATYVYSNIDNINTTHSVWISYINCTCMISIPDEMHAMLIGMGAKFTRNPTVIIVDDESNQELIKCEL